MKRVLFAVVTLLLCATAMARPVNADKARQVAGKFLGHAGIELQGDLVDISQSTPFVEFYTFTFNHGEGFILVAADDCVMPVLGYSTESSFDPADMPVHVQDWLAGYESQIRFYRSHFAGQNPDVAKQWSGKWPSKNGGKGVEAMVGTKWNQGDPFNLLCPIKDGDSKHAYTGCTATAMAQILRYWKYPEQGYGANSYKSKNYDTLSVDFSEGTYDWENMPLKLTETSPEAYVNAVGKLMYHCGVSVNMDYSTTGSGAFTLGYGRDTLHCSEYAFVDHFKYRNTLRGLFTDDFKDDEWVARMKNEFDNGRPVLYTGYSPSAGHAFVADGYDDNDFLHINWGWGGSFDGFFQVGHLDPGEGSGSNPGASSQGTYNLQCAALVGIQPNNDFGQGGKVEVTVDHPDMGSVSGAGAYDFGQKVTLWATAEEGHRFTGWSDGNRNNPRRFTSTGGDRVLEAHFAPLHPDTLTYATSNLYFGDMGKKNDHKYWGVRYPVSVVANGYRMTAVQFFPTHSANYDIEVFEGSVDENGKKYAVEHYVNTVNEKNWQTVAFDSALVFSGNKPVWVRLHSKGVEKTAVYTSSAGNIDSRLWGENLATDTMGNQSWMIRSVFQHPDSVNVEVHCMGSGDVVYKGSVVNDTWLTLAKGTPLSLGLRVSNGAHLQHVYVNDVDYRDSVLMVDTMGADTYILDIVPQEYTVIRAQFDDWNGIDQVEDNVGIGVEDGRIVVTGTSSYQIYDLSGRRIDDLRGRLQPGVYMVQVEGRRACKVVVM